MIFTGEVINSIRIVKLLVANRMAYLNSSGFVVPCSTFAMQGAQDNGEFFTTPSLVRTIVNVIEPTTASFRVSNTCVRG